jgi:hypothetical protein
MRRVRTALHPPPCLPCRRTGCTTICTGALAHTRHRSTNTRALPALPLPPRSCNYGETAFISFDALFGTFVATEADAIAHFGADTVKKALSDQYVAESGESKEAAGDEGAASDSGNPSGVRSGGGGSAARRVRSAKDVKKA